MSEYIDDQNEAFAHLMDQIECDGSFMLDVSFPDKNRPVKHARLDENKLARLDYHCLGSFFTPESMQARSVDLTPAFQECFMALIRDVAELPHMSVRTHCTPGSRYGVTVKDEYRYWIAGGACFERRPEIVLGAMAYAAIGVISKVPEVLLSFPPERCLEISASVLSLFWRSDAVELHFSTELSMQPRPGESLDDLEKMMDPVDPRYTEISRFEEKERPVLQFDANA